MRSISPRVLVAVWSAVLVAAASRSPAAETGQCRRTLRASVVAFDQPLFRNRLGSSIEHGTIYSLERDVVPIRAEEAPGPGNVELREDKRPRPIVLRMNVGDCLRIRFKNFLSPEPANEKSPPTRTASVHVAGLQPVVSIADDGSFVGSNENSLAAPGEERLYTLYAEHEGAYRLYSAIESLGGPDEAGQFGSGLFGAVIVEPAGAEWYRSQVTREDLALAASGRTGAGQPTIDYAAVYPPGHPRAGAPILAMLDAQGEIVDTDLTAVVTGPHAGRFPEESDLPSFRDLPMSGDRRRPYREVTVIYHEDWGEDQVFPWLRSYRILGVEPGRDTMAINYGSAGLAAQVFSNRLGMGPAWECAECKYEEFFLSSWAVGDPAMIVDVPANQVVPPGRLVEGPKATRAFYPDDPSNVYHSYLGDPVKFRVLHNGTGMNHVHHQHAYPWLESPNNPRSKYTDSQVMTPGAAFTMEINRAYQTPGDAIFHCHIYYHFAMGMWALWRIHDVFEEGTEMDGDGRPVPGARALPDGEIARGTPIPALVPLPTLPMAPMPAPVRLSDDGRHVEVLAEGNPGFPFFVPGVAGRRAPRPPMDMIHDGGLPRHVAAGSGDDQAAELTSRLDFSKTLERFDAVELPEEGTPVERAAAAAYAQGRRESFTPEGEAASFRYPGTPPVRGAPFADPCYGRAGGDELRAYRSASVQLDVVFNKKGWHYPQQRIMALWGDVEATLAGRRPPEPLFFRAYSGDCVELWHTNLVPNVKELDDFLVRTPTDIVGQHVHLVSYDVLGSDGAAVGFNYEDGTLSPDEVRERIAAINAAGGLLGKDHLRRKLAAEIHPYFGEGPAGAWRGAQTSVQRWYANPVLDQEGDDRTLRTVFVHDHFGPSTHQQMGLFASLLVEPRGSRWRDPETGELFYTRFDGGPTSWRADVLTADEASSFREFGLAIQNQQPMYEAGSRGFRDARKAVRAPLKPKGSLICNDGMPAPCPYMVPSPRIGLGAVNYRNEPLPLRLAGADPRSEAGDLAHVFRSIERADPELGVQPDFYPPLTAGMEAADPFTPLLRAYENDRVRIRVTSAHDVTPGVFSLSGLRWPFEPADPDSGYRAAQEFSTSETLEVAFTLPPAATDAARPFADYLYFGNASTTGLAWGMWGLLRAYDGRRPDLLPLPNNPAGQAETGASGGCPEGAAVRRYAVTAVAAATALPGGRLVYGPGRTGGDFVDENALLYVRSEDLDDGGRLRPEAPVEPLVLRAAAGECIEVRLTNALDPGLPGFAAESFVEEVFDYVSATFADVPLHPSRSVGLRPQLVAYDVTHDGGANAGANPVETVAYGESRTLHWYAGLVERGPDGAWHAVPAELGAANLLPADPMEQHPHGLLGALIIEPEASSWVEDAHTRASATVTRADGSRFREFVLLPQPEVDIRQDGKPLEKLARALNYRTEPIFDRLRFENRRVPKDLDLTCLTSNQLVGGEPQTPVFTAPAGMPVRFRLLNPGNVMSELMSFELDGHVWQEQPYAEGSRRIGSNPLSEWKGVVSGLGTHRHFDLVLDKAGGAFGVQGDYLYRFHPTARRTGVWGLFRVGPGAGDDGDHPDSVVVTRVRYDPSAELVVEGSAGADADTGAFAAEVRLYAGPPAGSACSGRELARAPVDAAHGRFGFRVAEPGPMPETLCVQSSNGGSASLRLEPEIVCASPGHDEASGSP